MHLISCSISYLMKNLSENHMQQPEANHVLKNDGEQYKTYIPILKAQDWIYVFDLLYFPAASLVKDFLLVNYEK